jgi:hypothetical protein
MQTAQYRKNPAVLSYLMLRQVVGFIALGLPFALMIPWWFICGHSLPHSISDYYYTGMRNLLEGSLCSIAMFNFFCLGYDIKDEIAGKLSGLFAFGVAFCPTAPDSGATHQQIVVGDVHLTFATLLFITLAYFCFCLFTLTTPGLAPTQKKLQRNLVYRTSGGVILASIVIIALSKWLPNMTMIGPLGTMFCFETTALIAFGIAWLVKGGTILKDAT